jgi:hypothetical protein
MYFSTDNIKNMNMSKIVSLQDTGRMWKDFHILEIGFDNNDFGTVLAKSTTPSYKVGDEVKYTKNDRGGVKIQRDEANFTNNSFSSGGKTDKSDQIARSVVFKGAIDLVAAKVIELKDIGGFVEKHLTIVTGEPAKGESYDNHFNESQPF